MASAAALRSSFVASRDGLAAQGADVSTQNAEIAIRDAIGLEAGWVGGSAVDVRRCEWYPTQDVAAQAAKYHAAEEGRGGVALQPGSVPWPPEARRCSTPGAPMEGSAPPVPVADTQAPPAAVTRPWWPWAVGVGALGLFGLMLWQRSR